MRSLTLPVVLRSSFEGFFSALLISLIFHANFAFAENEIPSLVSPIVERARWNVGVSVLDGDSGRELFGFNDHKPLKPASVSKIVTSAATLTLLGPDTTFSTQVLGSSSTRIGTLPVVYIRGGGDPSLTIESTWTLVRTLKSLGITGIKKLVLDDSQFLDARPPSGQRAYEAGSSALSFNNNSVSFVVCPGKSKGDKASIKIEPWESQAKLENKAVTGKGRTSGVSIDHAGGTRFVAKGNMGILAECARYYRSLPDSVEYFGTTLIALLNSVGIDAPKKFERGITPDDAYLIYDHLSKPLKSIVEDLNHFSNNFIGEQLLYLLGDTSPGVPGRGRFRREEGLSRLNDFIARRGFPQKEFRLEDGSGLSHTSLLSSRVVTGILYRVSRDNWVSPEFEMSLSVGFRSGTLKKREFSPSSLLLRGKTGTLDGVTSLAGYVWNHEGKKVIFSIIQNGTSTKEQGVLLEDRIVKALFDARI